MLYIFVVLRDKTKGTQLEVPIIQQQDILQDLSFHRLVSEKSGLQGYDDMFMGEWFQIFRRQVMRSKSN